jgi:hypothetical protein
MEWSCYSNAGTRRLVHYQQPGLVASSTTSSRDSLPRPLPAAGTRCLVHYREVELATDPWTKTPIWLLSGVV